MKPPPVLAPAAAKSAAETNAEKARDLMRAMESCESPVPPCVSRFLTDSSVPCADAKPDPLSRRVTISLYHGPHADLSFHPDIADTALIPVGCTSEVRRSQATKADFDHILIVVSLNVSLLRSPCGSTGGGRGQNSGAYSTVISGLKLILDLADCHSICREHEDTCPVLWCFEASIYDRCFCRNLMAPSALCVLWSFSFCSFWSPRT